MTQYVSKNLNADQTTAMRKITQEISNSLTRIEAERDFIKECIKSLEEKTGLDKKVLRKIAKTFHKQSYKEDCVANQEFEDIYGDAFDSRGE